MVITVLHLRAVQFAVTVWQELYEADYIYTTATVQGYLYQQPLP